jgi:hypothetical protein
MQKIIAFVFGTLLFTSTAFALNPAPHFSAPQPTAQQEAQIRTKLIAAAKRTAFYKGLVRDGNKPNVSVDFFTKNPPGFIGSGFRQAAVTIRSSDLASVRNYELIEGLNGKFRTVAEGKAQINTQPVP